MFLDQFPYTNMHEINLDWIIQQIKALDPKVIAALQQLDPDVLAQVTAEVEKANQYAISAQSASSAASASAENADKSNSSAAASASSAAGYASSANQAATDAEESAAAASNFILPNWIDRPTEIFNLNNISNVGGRIYYFKNNTKSAFIMGYFRCNANGTMAASSIILTWKSTEFTTNYTTVNFGYIVRSGNCIPLEAELSPNGLRVLTDIEVNDDIRINFIYPLNYN